MLKLNRGVTRNFIRGVAAFLCVSILALDIAHAQPLDAPGALMLAARNSSGVMKAPGFLEKIPEIALSIPSDYGKAVRYFQGTEPYTVILLQDAHVHEEAQRHLADLLTFFSNTYGLKLVNVEGAEGSLSTHAAAAFPDKEALRKAADYFLAQGRLTGAEYAVMMMEPGLRLYGAEDRSLYEENRAVYFKTLEFREKSRETLTDLKRIFHQLGRYVYGADMLELLRLEDGALRNSESLEMYVKTLFEKAVLLNIQLKDFPGMQKFLKLVEMERQIHFEEARAELEEVEKLLSKNFPDESWDLEASEIEGEMRRDWPKILEKMGTLDLRDRFSQAYLLAGYFEEARGLGIDLVEEVKELSRILKERLIQSPEEKTLDLYFSVIRVYEAFLDFSLTKDDVSFFFEHREMFSAESIRSFFEPLLKEHRFEKALPENLEDMDVELPELEKFYQTALARDEVLVERALEQMRKEKVSMGALVAGGFHSAGIERQLRAKNVSFVTVMPRMTEVGDEEENREKYQAVLSEKTSALEEVFKVSRSVTDTSRMQDNRFQLAAWLMSAHGETASLEDFRMKPLLWLAAAESLFRGTLPAPVADALLRSARNFPEEEYREAVSGIAAELAGGVLERRSEEVLVYWQKLSDGAFRALARTKDGERSPARSPRSAGSNRAFVDLGEGETLSVMKVDAYLVPEKIRKLLDAENEKTQTAEAPAVRSELRDEDEDSLLSAFDNMRASVRFARDLKEKQDRWLESAMTRLNKIFSEAEAYIQRQENVDGARLVKFLEAGVASVIRELEEIRDTDFYAQADAAVAERFSQRWRELMARVTLEASETLARLLPLLPDSAQQTAVPAAADAALEALLSDYRRNPDFFQNHSLEMIQKALGDYSKAAPAAARETRTPEAVRVFLGAIFFYFLPAIAAILLQGFEWSVLLQTAAFMLSFRLGYLALTLMHEWTHLFSAAASGMGKGAFTRNNFSAGLGLRDWFSGLFAPLIRVPRVMIPELRFGPHSSRHGLVRDAAWIFSGVAAAAAALIVFIYLPGIENLLIRLSLIGLAAGMGLSFFMGFWSDVIKRKPQGIYCCGNYGAALLIPDAPDSTDTPGLMAVRKRVVKSKRGQLPEAIRKGYQSAVRKRNLLERLRRPFSRTENPRVPAWFDEFLAKMAKITVIRGEQAGGEIGYIGAGSSRHVRLQGHSRYGTSSAPAVKETQPHTWIPERLAPVWIAGDVSGSPEKVSARVSSFVTHNGDFDAWEINGEKIPFDQVGLWLKKVLGVGHNARGDTPKLAGVVDYVFTQGMWDASLRFAFFEKAVTSAEASTPPPAVWKKWGAKMDEVFSGLIREGKISTVSEWSHVPESERALLVEALLQGLSSLADYSKHVPESARRAFAESAVRAFLDHDLYTTARIVKARSEGSFGVILTSSLQPQKTVLFAHSQPLFVGYDPGLNFVTWASEAAALKVTFTVEGRKRTLPYRFDLNQETGEILELRMEDGLEKEGEAVQAVRIYSEFLKRELTAEEVARSGRWIDTRENPLIDPLPDFDEKDLVGSDIRDIPSVLRAIQQNWQNPDSFNSQSARALLEMLIEKDLEKRIRAGVSQKFLNGIADEIRLRAAELKNELLAGTISGADLNELIEKETRHFNEKASRQPPPVLPENDFFPEGQGAVDVLLTGFEVSQWFGEQFVSDLSRLFPALTIEAVSANKVLNSMKEARFQPGTREFRIQEYSRTIRVNKNTIAFTVSQSGQTFPTLNATIALRAVLGNRVFAVTGGLDTLMGRAVGQVYAKGSPFSARIFDNLSGLRPAEPSTVATAATQATFTELLLYLGTEMKRFYGPRKPLGMVFENEDLATLRLLRDELNVQALPAITGSSPRNSSETVDSPVRRGLLDLGRRWARHILEPAIVTGIAVLIVGAFSYFGLPFFPSSWGLSEILAPSVLLEQLSLMTGFLIPPVVGTLLDGVLFVLANGIFAIILFPWLVTLGLRVLQSRYPLLARTGKRTLVIGDIPYVSQTLEAFVSKIFSLSYGFASLDVHSGNPRDHYLPRYGHRIVRGLLSLLMEPDARLRSQQDAVSGVRMTRSQQEGVRNLQVGAEVFTVTRKIPEQASKNQEVGLPVPNTAVQASIPDFVRRLGEVVELTPDKKAKLTEKLARFGELYRGNALHIAAHELGVELGFTGGSLKRFEEEFLNYGERQHLLENFYEKRFDSFERLVSAYVLFWEIGRRVSKAFRFLRLTYDMAASQSRTRVATTRSPVADVNLNLIFSQLGQPDTATAFNNPAVELPIRVETSESIREKSAQVLAPETRTQPEPLSPESSKSYDEKRKTYQAGVEMALEKIAHDFFNTLKELEEDFSEEAAAHKERRYNQLRREMISDLEWFSGKIDPTRHEELKYLFRRAFSSSRSRSSRLQALRASPAAAGQPSETFLRLRQAQSLFSEREALQRQIRKTFLPVTAETPSRAELRELSENDLKEAVEAKSRMTAFDLEKKILPGILKAEAAGLDVEMLLSSFSEMPEVLEALDLSSPAKTGTRGYYLFEYQDEQDLELLKFLIPRKDSGVIFVVFSSPEKRALLGREFASEISDGDLELPEMSLLEYLTAKSLELQIPRYEVLHLKPLERVKLKKNHEEALQAGLLAFASGGIVIRSEQFVPGARELRIADVLDQILKAALLISQSA